ncbi:hypothetical protein ZWY2020_003283 [Hordeum vulgare]|nr:hypothetical protein ZWY2020_003283 [Hordeum vulgare]
MVPKLVAPGASSDASSTGNEVPRPRLPPTCVPRAPLHPSLPSSSSAIPCRARPKLDPAAAAQHLRPTSPLAVPASILWSRAAPSADERPHVMVPKLVAPGASSDASSTGNEVPRPRLPPTCVPRAPLHPSLPSSSSAVPCRARPKLDPAAAAQHLRPTSPRQELTRGLPCTSPPRIDLAPRSSSLGQEHLVVLDLAAVGDQH